MTGYYVERREVSTEKWVRHNKTHITTTMYTLTGLIPDAEYVFRVVAQNDIGQSEPGPVSESVLCKDPFGMYIKHFIKFTVLGYEYILQTNINYLFHFFPKQMHQANQEKLILSLLPKTASLFTGSAQNLMVARRFKDTGLNIDRQVKAPGRNVQRNAPRTVSLLWVVLRRQQNMSSEYLLKMKLV